MKHKLFVLLVCSIVASTAWGQNEKGFYLKPSGSYFIKVTPVEFPNVGPLQPRDIEGYLVSPSADNPSVSETDTKVSTITGSFGQGWRAGLAGGYAFSRHLSFELSVNYFQSEEKRMTRQHILDFDRTTTALYLESKGSVKALDLAPSLVFWLGNDGTFKPYARIGAIVPVYGRLKIKTNIKDKYGLTYAQDPSGTVYVNNITLAEEDEIVPRPTVGFTGALGVKIPIASALSIFAEVEYRNVSVSSKTKEIKKYAGSGTAVSAVGDKNVTLTLEDLSYAQRHTIYEDTLDETSNVEDENGEYKDKNSASKDLRSYINIGGLGLNIGVIYKF
jgi:hypothetical protein